MKFKISALWLYFAFSFLRGFMFWYVLEKVFLRDAGVTDQQILLLACMRAIISLLLEVPTDALVPRWGYKKTLALSLVFLGWSGLQYLLSDNIMNFLLATSLWTASDALASGTLEAYLYRLVVRQDGSPARYRRFASWRRVLSLAGVMFGSLVGGLIAMMLPLWMAFAASVLPVLGAMAILAVLPSVPVVWTGKGKRLAVVRHGFDALRHVLTEAAVRRVVLAYIVVSLPALTFLELSQLQYLSVGLALALFGTVDFLRFGLNMAGNVFGGSRFGGALGGRRGAGWAVMLLAVLLWPLCAWQSPWSVLLICIITFVTTALDVNLEARLQHALPDGLRAAATSSVSFICNLLWCVLMVVVMIFGPQQLMHLLIGALAVIATAGCAGIFLFSKLRQRKETAYA